MTLVEVVPSGEGSKFTLRQADLIELPEIYETFEEAQTAMLKHNTKAWEAWEAEQPKAKAS